VKASVNSAKIVARPEPEAVVIYLWTGWSRVKPLWRSEPVNLEKFSDDLWVGVKGQSNPVIAGSLRNVFRCSVVKSQAVGRALIKWGAILWLPISVKLRIIAWRNGSKTAGDKLRCREGNNPEHQLRCQNDTQWKGGVTSLTVRMLA